VSDIARAIAFLNLSNIANNIQATARARKTDIKITHYFHKSNLRVNYKVVDNNSALTALKQINLSSTQSVNRKIRSSLTEQYNYS
jgi:hypothetical protein